jgi:hypothetical protein
MLIGMLLEPFLPTVRILISTGETKEKEVWAEVEIRLERIDTSAVGGPAVDINDLPK